MKRQLSFYYYLFFLLVTIQTQAFCALSIEQKAFIQTFSLSEVHKKTCDELFSKINIKQLTINPALDRKILTDYFLTLGFFIYKLEPYNRARVHDGGDIRIILSHPQLEGYIIKFVLPFRKTHRADPSNLNLSRIAGADRIRAVIEQKNLKLITVPKKYLFHIPGAPEELCDENYAVLAEKITIAQPDLHTRMLDKISFQHAQELLTVIKEVGYFDVHAQNLCITHNNKIAFIDTEARRGAWDSQKPFKWTGGIRKKYNGLLGKARLYKQNPKLVKLRLSLSTLLIALHVV